VTFAEVAGVADGALEPTAVQTTTLECTHTHARIAFLTRCPQLALLGA
jgi:hypothetical protein